MTTTNNITTTQQLSDYLLSKGVHHYLDIVSTIPTETKIVEKKKGYSVFESNTPLVQMKEIVEIPIAQISANDGSKFFNALNVCMELIDAGIAVVKSNCNNFLYLTPRGSVVAENN